LRIQSNQLNNFRKVSNSQLSFPELVLVEAAMLHCAWPGVGEPGARVPGVGNLRPVCQGWGTCGPCAHLTWSTSGILLPKFCRVRVQSKTVLDLRVKVKNLCPRFLVVVFTKRCYLGLLQPTYKIAHFVQHQIYATANSSLPLR